MSYNRKLSAKAQMGILEKVETALKDNAPIVIAGVCDGMDLGEEIFYIAHAPYSTARRLVGVLMAALVKDGVDMKTVTEDVFHEMAVSVDAPVIRATLETKGGKA